MLNQMPLALRVLIPAGAILVIAVVVAHIWLREGEPFHQTVWAEPRGDVERGRVLIEQYGCGSCHVIDGVRQANGRVGPRLEDLHEQVFIGGVVPNGPERLAGWIRDPQHFSPETAMPNLGVREAEALDIAAYLLRETRE